nr:hypothetical protein [Tanacetum cinerariifolium]
IAKRKNRTLIEAARTLLADSLLPIPFWPEAVNTACYVQNRVLVTKPHNKTPYELLHGQLPSIGFMRPFCCPVTILNTLDPLGKFQGKVDKGFLVGYSVCSKAFRTMNYPPVLAGNQTNSNVGFQDLEKAEEEGTQTYVLFPVLTEGSTIPKNNKDAHTGGNEHNDDIQKFVSPDIHSSSCGDQAREQGDKAVNKDMGKNHVVTITGLRDLNEEFAECINNSSNGVSAASPLVSAARLNFTNSTNDFSAAGPSNAAMPNLEDLSHNTNDVGAEADTNNMESIISISPIPTTRIHKDHPTFQIIGDLSSTTQTRIYKVVKALYGLHQAPRAWYETLATYLLENGFQRGTIDQTLFIKKQQKGIILVQIYVDDIIFGLQVKQKKDGIFISQDKYVAEILRKFGLSEGKSASTPIDAKKPLLKDLDVDVHTYRSMIGSLMYLTSFRPDIMFAVCACARF